MRLLCSQTFVVGGYKPVRQNSSLVNSVMCGTFSPSLNPLTTLAKLATTMLILNIEQGVLNNRKSRVLATIPSRRRRLLNDQTPHPRQHHPLNPRASKKGRAGKIDLGFSRPVNDRRDRRPSHRRFIDIVDEGGEE